MTQNATEIEMKKVQKVKKCQVTIKHRINNNLLIENRDK